MSLIFNIFLFFSVISVKKATDKFYDFFQVFQLYKWFCHLVLIYSNFWCTDPLKAWNWWYLDYLNYSPFGASKSWVLFWMQIQESSLFRRDPVHLLPISLKIGWFCPNFRCQIKKTSKVFNFITQEKKTPKVFEHSSKMDFQKTPKVFAEFRKFLQNSESFIAESFWTSL